MDDPIGHHTCHCADTSFAANVGGHGRACVSTSAVWERGHGFLVTAHEARQLAQFFESGEATREDVLMRLENAGKANADG